MIKRLSFGLLLSFCSLSVASAVVSGPPQNLTAIVNSNTVSLSWQPPTTGGVPASYVVQASLSPGGTAIASLAVPNSTLSVPNVANGIYYVRVRAVNVDGMSEASNEVIVVVPGGGGGCTSRPNPAQALTGSANGNVVNLNWNPPVGGCSATAYAVHAGASPGASNVAVVNVGGATSLSASAPAGTFYLRVVALNAFGGSDSSNEVIVTVGSNCQRPSAAPVLLSPSVSGSTIALTWLAPAGTVTGYVVEAGSSAGASNLLNLTTSATNYTWSTAPAGTQFMRVRAINACGVGPASNEVTATVSTPAPPPNVCGPTVAPCGQATARCNDGTYSCSQNRSGTCSSHSGVSCWICPGRLCSGDNRETALALVLNEPS